MIYVLFIVGLVMLLAGGEALVKGAVGLAVRIRVSRMVIGVTIVSFGTSAPELLVSLKAALDGHPAISIGNVIGSNIANLGLVMGLVAMIFPMQLDKSTRNLDWPVMMIASVLFYLMAYDGALEMYEGILLFILLVVYIVYSILKSRRDTGKLEAQKSVENVFEELKTEPDTPVWKLVLLVIGGSAGLVLGTQLFLDGAIEMARVFGVTEHVISVTLIAFGTSVPELATSAIAAFKKQSDISVGNLIGSNTFNILAILGITSIVKEIPISPNVISSDLFWMLATALLVFPFLLIGKKIYRIEGFILFCMYLAYIYFVVKMI